MREKSFGELLRAALALHADTAIATLAILRDECMSHGRTADALICIAEAGIVAIRRDEPSRAAQLRPHLDLAIAFAEMGRVDDAVATLRTAIVESDEWEILQVLARPLLSSK